MRSDAGSILLNRLNELDAQRYPGNDELAARISSYELAYRMQGCAPDAVNVNAEPGSSMGWTIGARSRLGGSA